MAGAHRGLANEEAFLEGAVAEICERAATKKRD